MTTKHKLKVIEKNFKEYFNATWLINYIYTTQNVKVSINLETLEVSCKPRQEFVDNPNILYFALPKIDFLIEGIKNSIMFKEFGTIQEFIKVIDKDFRGNGHFSVDRYNKFYLYDDLINILNNRKEVINEQYSKNK